MGGVFFFFFPSQNILTNIWHCLTESHLKCSFSDCPFQPALLWAWGLLASGSPFPANAFSGRWGWTGTHNGSALPHKKSCLRRCHVFTGCWFLFFLNRLLLPSLWHSLSLTVHGVKMPIRGVVLSSSPLFVVVINPMPFFSAASCCPYLPIITFPFFSCHSLSPAQACTSHHLQSWRSSQDTG